MTKPEDIQFNASISLDWDVANLSSATFAGAAKVLKTILDTAEKQAKKNVTAPFGPGPHPHDPDTGFLWTDTGKLANAIYQSPITLGRDESGRFGEGTQVTARLEVDPVDIPAGTDAAGRYHKRRSVPYGMYLELGWTPVLPQRGGGKRLGVFTRYPFLAPAMYMATKKIKERAALILLHEVQDKMRKSAKKKSILSREPITFDTLQRINRTGLIAPVQKIKDLDL